MFITAAAAVAALFTQTQVLVGYLTCADGEQIPVYADAPVAEAAPFKWPEPEELDLMARTLWGEARSQSDREIEAIAHVIVNRVESPRWPATFAGVIKEPFQFTVWNEGDPNRPLMVRLRSESDDYQRVFAIALDVVSRRYMRETDPTGGMTHYVHGEATPYWAATAISAIQVGKARFFKLRRP